MSVWERVLRMFGIHRDPLLDLLDDDEDDPELTKARAEVADLHRQADTVLTDFAAMDQLRRRPK